jgi:hypothetical protein
MVPLKDEGSGGTTIPLRPKAVYALSSVKRINPGAGQKQASAKIILPTTLVGIITAMVRHSRLLRP